MELWIVIATYIVLVLLIIFMIITCVIILVIKQKRKVYLDAVKEVEYESMSSRGSYENVVCKSIKAKPQDQDMQVRNYHGITVDVPQAVRFGSNGAHDDEVLNIPQIKLQTLGTEKQQPYEEYTHGENRQADKQHSPSKLSLVHSYCDKIYISQGNRDTWPTAFDKCGIEHGHTPLQGSNVPEAITEGTKIRDYLGRNRGASSLDNVCSPTDQRMTLREGPMYETIPDVTLDIQEGKRLTEKPFTETIISYSPRILPTKLSTVEEEQEVYTLTELRKTESGIQRDDPINDSKTRETIDEHPKATAPLMKPCYDHLPPGQKLCGASLPVDSLVIHPQISEAPPDRQGERGVSEVQGETTNLPSELLKTELQGDPSQLDDIGNVDIVDPYFCLRPTQIPQ